MAQQQAIWDSIKQAQATSGSQASSSRHVHQSITLLEYCQLAWHNRPYEYENNTDETKEWVAAFEASGIK